MDDIEPFFSVLNKHGIPTDRKQTIVSLIQKSCRNNSIVYGLQQWKILETFFGEKINVEVI